MLSSFQCKAQPLQPHFSIILFQSFKILFQFFKISFQFFKCANSFSFQGPVTGPTKKLVEVLFQFAATILRRRQSCFKMLTNQNKSAGQFVGQPKVSLSGSLANLPSICRVVCGTTQKFRLGWSGKFAQHGDVECLDSF